LRPLGLPRTTETGICDDRDGFSGDLALPAQSKLVCERCDLRFAIKDGFPILVAEEAELPPGCESLSDLPCQKAEAPAETNR
jgi:uncharacterized protein YbaR (Trm112 family)